MLFRSLFLWMNERKKEIGVLLAIGVSKTKIAAQLVLEILMIAVFSFSLSLFTAKGVAQNLGNDFVSQSSKNTTKEINKALNGNFSADADSAVSTKTIDHIDVEVRPELLISTVTVGASVMIVSILVGAMPMLRTKPKKLLMEIE